MTELKNLLKVKSIITLLLTAMFVFLACTGTITADRVADIFNIVVAFYFGTQQGKASVNG